MSDPLEPLWNNSAVHLLSVPLENVIREWGATTGISGPDVIWFRPAELMVVELVLMNLLYFLVLRRLRNWKMPSLPIPKRLDPSIFEAICGLILVACAICQVFFKILRPSPLLQVLWLVMPCHLHTYAWIYVLLTTTSPSAFSRRRLVVSVLLGCHWAPASGVFPDFSDQRIWLEPYVFILQHALLILLPYYWAVRYGVLPLSVPLVARTWSVAFFQHFMLFPVVSCLSGLNMNYFFRGPPHSLDLWPFTTIYFRFKTTLVLMILTFVFSGLGLALQTATRTLRRK